MYKYILKSIIAGKKRLDITTIKDSSMALVYYIICEMLHEEGERVKKAQEYFQEYISEKSKSKSRNTIIGYQTDMKQFFKHYTGDLVNLSNTDIDDYKQLLLSRKLAPKTINRKLVSLRQFIEYINTHSDIKVFVEIKLLKIQSQDYLEEVLDKSDYDRLVRMAERENDIIAVTIFNTLYLSGARVSEALQIKISDIGKDQISVLGKGSKYRDLFIPESLKTIWFEYATERHLSDDESLFKNKANNNRMSRQTVHNIIKKYAGIAKVKLSKAHAHNFRHLYAFRLRDLGLSQEEIADLLGHTDINTTKIYTRKTKDQLLKAIKKLT